MSGAGERGPARGGGGKKTRAGGPRGGGPSRGREPKGVRPGKRPPLRVEATTLWEYPSQHYDSASGTEQGSKDYVGATPSWVIWQLLQRYTREKDLVVDPMVGSGTTMDVARDLGRRALGYDLAPQREGIIRADARKLPLEDGKADFVFVDPPYSTHVDYSDDPACIGKLDAAPDSDDEGRAYYEAMAGVISEIDRVLRNRRYMALYVSDSWRKRKGRAGDGGGVFVPIGFTLFSMLSQHFTPVDIVSVVRHNAKLSKGNWRKAAVEGNYFLRGFNYLLIMKKVRA